MAKTLMGATAGSTDSPFQKDNIAGLKGKLFVIEPLEVEKDIETTNGTSDAVRANTWVIRSADGTKYDEYEDVLIFQRVLQGQLRKAMGKSVVFGRLTQGENKKGNPPWLLADPTEKDVAAATAFWNSRSMAPATSGGDEPEDDGDAF